MKRKAKDSAINRFLKVCGPGDPYRPYEKKDDIRLAKRIPGVMRNILKRRGWCSYEDQVLWFCDPDDWKLAAKAWFPEIKNAQVLVRSGFGDVWVWDGKTFFFAMVHESLVIELIDEADWFFKKMLTDNEYISQTLPTRVSVARQQTGSLEWDEMYTYVPALAIGGSVTSSRIDRVKALEAITMLAELTTIRRV